MRFTGIGHRRWVLLALFATTTAVSASATTWTVQASGFLFTPQNLIVAPGDTIHWDWLDGTHTVTSGTGCVHNTTFFNAPLDLTHKSFDFVVPSGVPSIPYFCNFHCAFGMTGLITVQSTDIRNLVITLDGAQEVPPVTTAAIGSGTATLDAGTNLFSWNYSYSGLSSAETAAHFHGAALPCFTAGAIITLPAGSPKVGSAALNAGQAADLLAGKWYTNVHTTNDPNGEIRGQVMPAALTNPIPATIPTGSLRIRLQPLVTGLTAPVWATAAPGQPGRLYVVEQTGFLWAVNTTSGARSLFLDVSGRLVPLGIGGPGTYDERGFLGTAFHPNYATNGLLYTYTSEPVSGTADFSTMPPLSTANCQSALAEWHVPSPTDPNSVVDTGSRRELLRIDKPQFNHNGGGLVFGPDGYLYVSTGDGGNADDQGVGHMCGGNGQDTTVILGKMLRIDPLGTNSANGRYGIPPTNPFVGGGGLGEIYAYGLRNPWRYSFDSGTGTLYCADVGQNKVEEIDTVTSGGNYGWRDKEGSFYFVFNGNQAGYVTDVPLTVPGGLIDPIAEYDHDEGIAVIGGFVYRGSRIPGLGGKYVFGDLARTFSNDGRLFYLDTGNQIKEFQLAGQTGVGYFIYGFGQDAAGELYLLGDHTGTPSGTTGAVLKLGAVLCPGDMNCDGRVTFADIDLFVAALSGESAWTHAAQCPWLNADCNGDQHVTFADIDPFVAVIGTTCPP
jgi:glucose/arabinose dehydrogenase/plastocyanin